VARRAVRPVALRLKLKLRAVKLPFTSVRTAEADRRRVGSTNAGPNPHNRRPGCEG
jgi:hypothetical protein